MQWGMRWLAAVVAGAIAIAAAGCADRCAEIASRRSALLARTQVAAGPHAQVRIPLARANAFLAALLHDQPIRVPIAGPSLGPFAAPELVAVAREVELRPAPAGQIQFAIRIELDDAEQPIATLAVTAEVVPQFVRTADASELVAGFGPDSVLAVKSELSDQSGHRLADVVARWLPKMVRDNVPRAVIDSAAARLGEYLTSGAYDLMRDTLLRRLGDRTRLRLQLPALPITRIALAETTDALTFDITTDLPVRGGLAARAIASDEVAVRISTSTAAEIANWSIDHGYLPQHYTRDLDPVPDGAYRPHFDYVAQDKQRPVKIHLFQDRGGCSYFQVGMALHVDASDDQLNIALVDRRVEEINASGLLEAGVWLKQLIFGSVSSTRHLAAHGRLSFGERGFVTRIVRADVANDEVTIALQVVPEPIPAAARTSGTPDRARPLPCAGCAARRPAS
jgi:hypothetical protein